MNRSLENNHLTDEDRDDKVIPVVFERHPYNVPNPEGVTPSIVSPTEVPVSNPTGESRITVLVDGKELQSVRLQPSQGFSVWIDNSGRCSISRVYTSSNMDTGEGKTRKRYKEKQNKLTAIDEKVHRKKRHNLPSDVKHFLRAVISEFLVVKDNKANTGELRDITWDIIHGKGDKNLKRLRENDPDLEVPEIMTEYEKGYLWQYIYTRAERPFLNKRKHVQEKTTYIYSSNEYPNQQVVGTSQSEVSSYENYDFFNVDGDRGPSYIDLNGSEEEGFLACNSCNGPNFDETEDGSFFYLL